MSCPACYRKLLTTALETIVSFLHKYMELHGETAFHHTSKLGDIQHHIHDNVKRDEKYPQGEKYSCPRLKDQEVYT